MKKRLLASLLALVMTLTMLPATALAAEGDLDKESPQITSCTVTEGCILENGHEGDCVTTPAEGDEIPNFVPCTAAEGCTLENGHEGDCIVDTPETPPIEEGTSPTAGTEPHPPVNTTLSEKTGEDDSNGGLPTADDGVIKLTDNVTLTDVLTINEDTTIDLNGKTLTLPVLEKGKAGITVSDGARLTIQDSGNENTNGKLADTPSTDTSADGRTDADLIVVESGGSLEITGGTIGAILDNAHGATQIVVLKSNSTFKMSGGSLAGYTAGVQVDGGSKNVAIDISGGKIEGKVFGVSIEGGTTADICLEVSGGEITGTSQYSGIGIQNNAAGTFTISGESTKVSGGTKAVENKGNCTFTIYGGTFGKSSTPATSYKSVDSTKGTFQIFGGTFATSPDTSMIPTGLKAEQKDDDSYEIVADENNYAAKIGDDSYSTLMQAAEAAKSGDTITLLRNAESTPVTIPDGVTVEAGEYVYYGTIKVEDAEGNEIGDYNTLPEAVSAAANYQGAVLTCAPNSRVLFQAYNAHLHNSLTINGNNATVVYDTGNGPDNKDNYNRIAIEDSVNFTSDVTLTINELNNISVWGYRKTSHNFTLNMNDCNLVGNDNNATSRVYISTTSPDTATGQNNYNLTDCTFSHPSTSIYSNAAGTINIKNCAMKDGVNGINISNKSKSGDLNITIDGCSFTDIMQSNNEDYSAPIRIVSEATGKTTATINDCTFTLTNEENSSKQPNGDIALYDEGKTGSVTAQITNTNATVKKDGSGSFQKVTSGQNQVFAPNDSQITLPSLPSGWYWVDENGNRYEGGATVNNSAVYTAIEYTSSSTGGGSSSSEPSYSPKLDVSDGGTIKVSPRTPSEDDEVTITVTPDDGYELDELTVTDRNGREIDVTAERDGTYTFVQPRGRVTIEVTFVEIVEEPETLPFVDVPTDAYYYDAVAWAVENGVTGGTSATTFSPDNACTRAQMVTFLWRAAGSPEPESSVNPFADVSSSAYYYKAVLWAVEQGITNGTSATTFSPDATVTRSQTVTFLWRNAGSPAASGSSFVDVAAGAYYTTAVAWAAREGITSGTSATTFSPDNACTRAQIVTFLYRDLAE